MIILLFIILVTGSDDDERGSEGDDEAKESDAEEESDQEGIFFSIYLTIKKGVFHFLEHDQIINIVSYNYYRNKLIHQ